MIQREQALLEQRNINKQNAKSMYGVTVNYEHVEFTVLVQDKRNSTESLDLPRIAQAVKDYLGKGIEDGKDFDVILNDIYDTVASVYPERDVEVKVFDTVEKYTVTKIYNHQ